MGNVQRTCQALLLETPGNIGDVLTRTGADEVEFGAPGGIAGIAVENAGVPVAGGPFTAINAATGAFVNSGAGVATYTPPAVSNAWTTVSKSADQAVGPGALVSDTELFTGALVAGTKYRIRLVIFWNNQSSNGGQGQFLAPALTRWIEHQWFQNFGNAGNVNCVNVGVAPTNYQNGNTGEGAFHAEVIFTPSANGIVTWQFSGSAAGAGNLTVYAGSYLEYGVA